MKFIICGTLFFSAVIIIAFYGYFCYAGVKVIESVSVGHFGSNTLFSGDFRNVNVNSAVASVIGKYLLMNYTMDKRMFDYFNESELIKGDTAYWTRGVNGQNMSRDDDGGGVCNNTGRSRRRIYVIRHTEKLSKVMPNWVNLAFDEHGE